MKNTSMPKKFLEKQSFGVSFPFLWVGCLLSLLAGSGILQAAKVDKIEAGGSHSLILKTDGSLWAVGKNNWGQLGDGTNTDKDVPVKIESSGVTAISAGGGHSLYIKSDGVNSSLWAFGLNSQGQLGNGSFIDSKVPLEIISTGVVSISAGDEHSLYTLNNSSSTSLFAMGRNSAGQLGNGSTTQSSTPIQIDDNNITSISAGWRHSLYIKNDGTGSSLYGVGANDFGQLGDGSDTNQTTPVLVESSGVTEIAAGGNHSLYIKDQKLWAMGDNQYGQLGDSTNWNRNRPILVPGISGGVTQIFAGLGNSLYKKTDDTFWIMGRNEYGQLGLGNIQNQNLPQQLSGFNLLEKISLGYWHTLFFESNGNLTGVGANTSGQLGNDSLANTTVRVAMQINYLTLSVSGTGGTVPSLGNFAYDESVTISATPNIGFVFEGWSGDKTSLNNPYTFNMQEDLEISASFSQDIGDNDNDGLTNYEELINLGTNPDDNDTDNDGFNDFDEDRTVGLDPNTANTGLKTFFLASETAAYGNGFTDGNDSGQSYVEANYADFSFFVQSDLDAARADGINMVEVDPGDYDLVPTTQRDSEVSAAEQAGKAVGIAMVQANPGDYAGVFQQSDLDMSYSQGFTDGNASGIAYVQANPSRFNFLTDAERNASYDQGYSEGNASGILWVQNNLSAYDLATADELAAAVDAAKAEALAEVQADLATEGLSSLTYLDQVTGQSIPNTDGWYFQPGLGWLWTNRETFPFIYRQETDTSSARWLYFSQLPEQTDKPLYDYESKTWISFSGN
jgi:alpha-tubulin suppressor-like RCC1 family protein